MAFGVGVIVAATIFVVTGASPELWVDRPAPKAASTRWRLGVSLADTAWLLLGTSLVIGPIRVLRGGRPARHLPARRRISVVAAIFAAAHLVVGLSVHGDLSRPWRSFFSEVPSTGLPIPIRFSFLVLANWIGVATMVGLALLAAISNSASIRRLGAPLEVGTAVRLSDLPARRRPRRALPASRTAMATPPGRRARRSGGSGLPPGHRSDLGATADVTGTTRRPQLIPEGAAVVHGRPATITRGRASRAAPPHGELAPRPPSPQRRRRARSSTSTSLRDAAAAVAGGLRLAPRPRAR